MLVRNRYSANAMKIPQHIKERVDRVIARAYASLELGTELDEPVYGDGVATPILAASKKVRGLSVKQGPVHG